MLTHACADVCLRMLQGADACERHDACERQDTRRHGACPASSASSLLEAQGGSSSGRRGVESCGYNVLGVSASASMCSSPCYNASCVSMCESPCFNTGELNRCLVVSSSVSLGDLGDVTGGPESELSVLKDLSPFKDLSSMKAAGDSTCVSNSNCVSLVHQPQPPDLQPPLSCHEDTTAVEEGGRELVRASKELARASCQASCEPSCEALLQADDDDVIGAQYANKKKCLCLCTCAMCLSLF